jgi:hypothetical protein
LKFSGSWKTVRTSPSAVVSPADDFSLLSPEPSVGEIGIVSSGTCWSWLGAAATSVIVNVSVGSVLRDQGRVDSQMKLRAEKRVCVSGGGWWWDAGER